MSLAVFPIFSNILFFHQMIGSLLTLIFILQILLILWILCSHFTPIVWTISHTISSLIIFAIWVKHGSIGTILSHRVIFQLIKFWILVLITIFRLIFKDSILIFFIFCPCFSILFLWISRILIYKDKKFIKIGIKINNLLKCNIISLLDSQILINEK